MMKKAWPISPSSSRFSSRRVHFPDGAAQHFPELGVAELAEEGQRAQLVELLRRADLGGVALELREGVGEVARHLEPGLVAHLRVLRHRLLHDLHQLLGQVGAQLLEGHGILVEDLVDHRDRVLGAERELAGEQLVHHHAERVDVGLDGRRLLVDLLGRHVGRRAEEALDLRVRRVRDLGGAEVADLDVVALGQQDVGRLDVAVDHAVLEGVVERAAHLEDHQHRLAHRQQVRLGAVLLERAARARTPSRCSAGRRRPPRRTPRRCSGG